MIFSNKLMLGAAALLIATAASFPQELSDRYLGTHHQDMRQREALKICQENSLEFVRFFARDRDACFGRMRNLGTVAAYSGVWSKPHRGGVQTAQVQTAPMTAAPMRGGSSQQVLLTVTDYHHP